MTQEWLSSFVTRLSTAAGAGTGVQERTAGPIPPPDVRC